MCSCTSVHTKTGHREIQLRPRGSAAGPATEQARQLAGRSSRSAAMNRFLSDNAIHPIVDRVYGLDEAPKAFAYLRTGSQFGKIVVKL